MTERTAATEAKLGVAFTLECRDKDGNLLKTIDVKGGIPIELKEEEHGLDSQQPC